MSVCVCVHACMCCLGFGERLWVYACTGSYRICTRATSTAYLRGHVQGHLPMCCSARNTKQQAAAVTTGHGCTTKASKQVLPHATAQANRRNETPHPNHTQTSDRIPTTKHPASKQPRTRKQSSKPKAFPRTTHQSQNTCPWHPPSQNHTRTNSHAHTEARRCQTTPAAVHTNAGKDGAPPASGRDTTRPHRDMSGRGQACLHASSPTTSLPQAQPTDPTAPWLN